MKSLEALGGAGGEVTGSAYLLTTNKDEKLLIDCGAFQSGKGIGGDSRNGSLSGHDPKDIHFVVLTHAHADHIGRLPFFYESDAKIYATHATRDLAKKALENSQKLSPSLYPNGSVKNVIERIDCVPYDTEFPIDGSVGMFRYAGHIAGSTILEVKEKGGDKIVFSGDLGPNNHRIMKPRTSIKDADIVVMETTYGDRNRPEEDLVEVLREAVERTKKNRGTLLIPTFAIDRTQIVLNILRGLKKTLGNMPVFLDSPMAIDVTKIYQDYHQLFNDELRGQKNPFGFEGLTKTYGGKESMAIKHGGPKIIIAGSGMMSGGRIIGHAIEYLPDSKNVILFTGYAAEGTPSRAITDGEKDVEVDNEPVHVEATVLRTSALSAHADQGQLLKWLGDINGGQKRLRKVILIHGNDNSREGFAKQVTSQLGIEKERIVLPAQNEPIDLFKND